MPRYFFHATGDVFGRDTEGLALPDRQAARREAIRYAGHVMADEPDIFQRRRDFRVEVTDEAGSLLFIVTVLALDAPP